MDCGASGSSPPGGRSTIPAKAGLTVDPNASEETPFTGGQRPFNEHTQCDTVIKSAQKEYPEGHRMGPRDTFFISICLKVNMMLDWLCHLFHG
jgi:hypothetical protein